MAFKIALQTSWLKQFSITAFRTSNSFSQGNLKAKCFSSSVSCHTNMKRPGSPFSIFVKSRMTAVKEANPESSNADCMKILGTEWRSATKKDTQKYKTLFEKQRQLYSEHKKLLSKGEKEQMKNERQIMQQYKEDKRTKRQIKAVMDDNPDLKEPKRPVSLVLFCAEKKGILTGIDKNSWIKYQENYDRLSNQEREAFAEEREVAMKEYKEKHSEWVQNMVLQKDPMISSMLTSLILKQELKNLGKPTRPITSFFAYLRAHEIERGNQTPVEFIKSMSERFQHINEEEKEQYKSMHKKEMAAYKTAMAEWITTMMKSGKYEVVTLIENILSERRREKVIATKEKKMGTEE